MFLKVNDSSTSTTIASLACTVVREHEAQLRAASGVRPEEDPYADILDSLAEKLAADAARDNETVEGAVVDVVQHLTPDLIGLEQIRARCRTAIAAEARK